MNFKKVKFKNEEGDLLAGRLELPINQEPHNYAVFAHCFTCTKNFTATKNICRTLTDFGFGVLRFDFTGLGNSEGEFADSNFSGNIEDLVDAANFLAENHKAPTLIVGHSLGGTAAIFAALKIPSIKAVAVINSPSRPSHVKHLLKESTYKINKNGKAKVNLGGIDFTIKKQFLDDLKNKSLTEIVANLNKALLILHSPQDTTVGIKNAEEIYDAARHPKSFVSLNGADHLISKKEDSQYAGKVIAGWATRYVDIPPVEELVSDSKVVASLDEEDKYTTQLKMADHHFIADEPIEFGGNNYGPSPYRFLSAGLAACTVMTLQMYARRKNWYIENITCHINYSKDHAVDSENNNEKSAKIDTFTRKIKLTGTITEEQKKRLLKIADKCPVHKTLHSKSQIITKLME